MAEAHHGIKAVALRTGLTAHVIRIWEKRYGAVEPERTGTNRRLYSEEQIERLILLRAIKGAGHSIASVAKLPTENLRKLAAQSETGHGHARPVLSPTGKASRLDECIAAVRTLDSRALEHSLERS